MYALKRHIRDAGRGIAVVRGGSFGCSRAAGADTIGIWPVFEAVSPAGCCWYPAPPRRAVISAEPRGAAFPSDAKRYADAATELEVYRLTAPSYASTLPAWYNRSITRNGSDLCSAAIAPERRKRS